MATTPVDPTQIKATPREMGVASQAWFRWHPGYQTILDSRNPVAARAGYIDHSLDPIGHRNWLLTFENAVMDAP
jgi:hypothetical protein